MKHSTLGVSDFQYRQLFRQLLPTRLLQQAVRQTTAVTRRARRLPAFLVLASLIAWFFDACVKLPDISAWWCRRFAALPSDAAIYQARDRLGWAPLRWLCRRVLRPLADARRDPTAFYRGFRLLALDGTTLTVADTPDNVRTFGRAKNQKGGSGFPLLRLVAVCEVGTHALIAWVARRFARSEQALARRLWAHLPPGSLVVGDRNFHHYDLWPAAQRGGWQLLLRVQAGPKFLTEQVLSDGSYLSTLYPRRGKGRRARGLRVRVIVYRVTDAQGQTHTSRLLTSLLDATKYPAEELVALYHQRWEQEGVFREIKGELRGRTTHLRAEKPLRVLQELDGLLLGHWVLRAAMLAAARAAGVPPLSLSFVGTLRVLRRRLGTPVRRRSGRGTPAGGRGSRRAGALGVGARWWASFLAEVGRQRLQERRPRSCPRKKKVTRCAWPAKKTTDQEQPLPTMKVVPQALP